MALPEIRINARLTGEDALRYQQLLEHSGCSASDLLRDALREYHALHLRPRRNPQQLLAGFIGGGAGPEDLSTHYKAYLADALEEKLPTRVQDAP